jgi:protease-4
VLEYSKPTFRESLAEANTKIGIVYAAGTIMPGKSSRGWGESVVGSSSITHALKQAREDKTVKAIVLRIDSPGGSPSASDLIWREVKVTSMKKPVVVSMSDVAASGGYYIAMGASKIFASPSTITGSIGVYGGKFYLKGLYDKIGLNKEIIKRGEHADLFSDYVPFSEEEWTIIREHMEFTYQTFTRKAAEGRKKTQQQIHEVAQGRVWTGDQGVKLGLVDRIGGLNEAIEEAKKLAKITDKEVGFAEYPAPEGALSDLFSSTQAAVPLQAQIKELLLWAQIANQERALLIMPYKFLMN